MNFFGLLAFVLLIGAAQAAPLTSSMTASMDEVNAGKARLLNKLETDLAESRKQADELRAYLRKYGSKPPPADDRQALRFSIDPQLVLNTALQRQQDQQAFLEMIRQTDARQIPQLLQTVFLSCEQGRCMHRLDYSAAEEAIAAFGAPALQPLLDGFKTLDAPRKESSLNLLLRITPAQCPTAVLDQALGDQVFRVRAASLNVYKRNCAAKAFDHSLNRLLERETEATHLIYLLDQVPEDGRQESQVFQRLIQLVQDRRIAVDQAFGKLCSRSMTNAPLNSARLDIPFWWKVFEANPARQGCLIENLFLKVDQEKSLRQLRPLFQSAAAHRYRFNAVQGLSGPATMTPGCWDAIPGVDERMLAVFNRRLSPAAMRAWLADATMGEKLLLTQWLGQDMQGALPGRLQLHLEVRSPAGEIVSSTIQPVKLGQPFQFTLAPRVTGFQEIRYDGTVTFDDTRLQYRIKPLIVGLKPAGAGFEAIIPVTGRFETDLLLRQEKFRWKIRLTPAPD